MSDKGPRGTQSCRERPCAERPAAVTWPQAKGCRYLQKLKRQERPSPRASGGVWPCPHLDLTGLAQSWERRYSCCFKLPSVLLHPQEIHSGTRPPGGTLAPWVLGPAGGSLKVVGLGAAGPWRPRAQTSMGCNTVAVSHGVCPPLPLKCVLGNAGPA